MAKAAYVIFRCEDGFSGVVDTWAECSAHTNGTKSPVFRGYDSRAEAEKAFAEYKKTRNTTTRAARVKKKKALPLTGNIPGTDLPANETSAEFFERIKKFYENHSDYYEVISDGACRHNPGPGGAGFVIVSPEKEIISEGYRAEKSTTNNRMELQGAIDGLRELPDGAKAMLFTDSIYVYQLFGTDLAARDHKPRIDIMITGTTRSGTPVKNMDQIREIHDLAEAHGLIVIPRPIKNGKYASLAHEGEYAEKIKKEEGRYAFPYNKICDLLADKGRDMVTDTNDIIYTIRDGEVIDHDTALIVRDLNEYEHGIPVHTDGTEVQTN